MARTESSPPAPSARRPDLDQTRRAALAAVLERLGDADATDGLCDPLYEAFFERCPEARPLFGVHAVSEREEMLQETMRCLVAFCDDAPWLEGNLRALGASHLEYGVEDAMYPPFADVVVAQLAGRVAPALSREEKEALRGGLEALCAAMQRGARAASDRSAAATNPR